MTGSLNERIGSRNEEEVAPEHVLSFTQLLLSLLEVEVDVERLDEIGDRVGVFVVFLTHNTDEILQLLLVKAVVPVCAIAVGDDAAAR